ncbi:enoyl-CoA hydratase/isomerase family protein [Marinicella sp. S1101]|uniref:enoyl-CoA hydratase/isomerase family protein n=1 Tax=Marinicella marina TaxID=2996016 RepID=UPI002260ECBF|nr:enoyl-CoA hydratase/isomerase family protein [Marinicella marina]MCX7553825.1 enoyl-CoA hydratase/isomerase family protein [Marinicella marina]MDJ1140901.1 enoyl-CoA hydratase/isomerase family protein [Marinicella marina]
MTDSMEQTHALSEHIKTKLVEADFGLLGKIVMDKPKALNALSTDMIEAMQATLDKWAENDAVKVVWIEGAGDKAFCAGGDVVMLYHSMKETAAGKIPQKAHEFFTKEYHLDQTIHEYPKPVIVYADGIVMGGGLGVAVGGSHRIVTERSMIAMPEVTIGLYPDVGASWFFNRMPGKCAEFLGMTGARMNAADALFTKLADFAVATDDLADMQLAILESDGSHDGITQAIQASQMEQRVHESQLWVNYELINELMAPTDLVDVVQQFKDLETEDKWLGFAAKALIGGCPMTLHLVREQITRAKHMSLKEVFAMELIMSTHCVMHPDLAEGIRALLIDKDGQPQWSATSVDEISTEQVQVFFQQPNLGN